jgi:hypothetical protein
MSLVAASFVVLLVVSSASAAKGPRTVALKVTIVGAGTVKSRGKPSIKCASTCHRTLHVKKGSRLTLVATPETLGKLGPWKGACKDMAPKCKLRMTRNKQVAVTFIPPGAQTNPIPLKRAWKIGNGWTLKVAAVTPNADGLVIDNFTDMPALPPSGAQFFMLDLALTYGGGGSSSLTPLSVQWSFEGSHNFKYGYFDDQGCGPSADVSLPTPDLQPKIEFNQTVFSGGSVNGNICMQIASNDASTLLFNTGYPDNTWFALH